MEHRSLGSLGAIGAYEGARKDASLGHWLIYLDAPLSSSARLPHNVAIRNFGGSSGWSATGRSRSCFRAHRRVRTAASAAPSASA
jgi:hypothetical protein